MPLTADFQLLHHFMRHIEDI